MRLILSFTCVQRENNRISLFREGGADGPWVWRACLSIYLSAYVSIATKIHSCSVHGTDASRWHDVWLPVEVTWAQPHNNRHHFNLAISTQFVSMALKVDGFLRKHWLPWRPDTVVTQSNNGLVAGMPLCTKIPVMMTKFQTMASCLITGSA